MTGPFIRIGREGIAVHYQMRQKLVSIGDDFWIEDAHGEQLALVHKAACSGHGPARW